MTNVLDPLFVAFAAAAGIYASVVLFTRLAGLRSFSKLSSFDFAITVAFGSVIGGVVASEDPAVIPAMAGLASLYLLQMALSVVRRRVPGVSALVDNRPILLMAGSRVIDENLGRANITRDDLRAKLREANVIRRDEIHAVVMESTGDVSVLHGTGAPDRLDPSLLEGVDGVELLR